MDQQPYNTSFKYLTDLQSVVGHEVGITAWMQIDQKRINDFAETTDDHQWIHIDAAKSKLYSPYGCTIAHGYLILSLASKFAYACYEILDAKMIVNYGLDKVRFINAVKVNAEIRGRLSILSYDEKKYGAKLKLGMTIEIKGEEKPACVAELIGLGYT